MTRPLACSPDEIEAMKRLARQGLTRRAIATRLKRDEGTVQIHLGLSPGRKPCIPSETIERIVKLARSGKSATVIARAVGHTVATVRRYALPYLPRRALTEADIAEINRLRGEGLSVAAIADEIGCSDNTVVRYSLAPSTARTGRPPKFDYAEAYRLVETMGMKRIEVARRLGVSHASICRAIAIVKFRGG